MYTPTLILTHVPILIHSHAHTLMHVHTDTLAYTLTCTHASLTFTFPHSQSHRHTLTNTYSHNLHTHLHLDTHAHAHNARAHMYSHSHTHAHAPLLRGWNQRPDLLAPRGSARPRLRAPVSWGLDSRAAPLPPASAWTGRGLGIRRTQRTSLVSPLFSRELPVPLPIKDAAGSPHPHSRGPSHLTSIF